MIIISIRFDTSGHLEPIRSTSHGQTGVIAIMDNILPGVFRAHAVSTKCPNVHVTVNGNILTAGPAHKVELVGKTYHGWIRTLLLTIIVYYWP